MKYFKKKNSFSILPIELLTPRQFIKYELLCTELTVPYPILKENEVPDMFEIFSTAEIERLRHNKNTFFIFDYTNEGNSYKEYINFFEALEFSADKYNIPYHKIFFISSNLLEENNNKNINVISFNRWDYFNDSYRHIPIDTDFLNKAHFLSLNRVIRHFRILTIIKLFNSKIKNNLRISYDHLSLDLLKESVETHFTKTGEKIDYSILESLSNSSPSVLDRTDFNINWVKDMPCDLFNSTIVSLVGETLQNSLNGTSLFYSEKTFKPMIFNHPIFIFGQPNMNKHLENLGYKTYEKFFNLNFDSIEDYGQRLNKQIENLEYLNDQLRSMTVKQKQDWYMQGIDVIQHNKQMLKEQTFNKKKSLVLLEYLKQYTS